MDLKKITNEVLQYLYEGYQQSPTAIYDIAEIVQQHGVDPHEFGKHLLDSGFINNQQFRPTSFVCQINMNGINEIAPSYINDNFNKIVSTLGIIGQEGIMEILKFEPKDFQAAFNLVKYMEDTGYINEGIYQHNDIIIELSLKGKEFYENNKAVFRN